MEAEQEVALHVSVLTNAPIAYFAEKAGKDPFKAIKKLLYWLEITELEGSSIEHVLTSRFKDFEDGLQYFSALTVKGLDFIVTRDLKGYESSSIPVLMPTEFLSHFESGKI